MLRINQWHYGLDDQRDNPERNIADLPGDGIKLVGSLHSVERLKVLDNDGDGISLGAGATVIGTGLYSGILVDRSIASGNGGTGIAVGRESLVRGSISRANGGSGLTATRTGTAPFVTNTMTGYSESIIQLNGEPAVVNLIDLGSNLCFECP